MSNQPSSQPILCIDLKKNRIRIHKHTLHMLGDPEYIQLLVNPCTHMIAVRKSVRQDYLAHHVRACYSGIRNSYELYSRELLQTLRQTNSELSNNRSYRIYGAINQKENGQLQKYVPEAAQLVLEEITISGAKKYEFVFLEGSRVKVPV